MLNTPNYRMSVDGHECGWVAVRVAAAVLGVRTRSSSKLAKLANPVQGTGPETVAAMLHALGLRVLSGPMTRADLRHFTLTGRPVICPTSLHGGHYVVVRDVCGTFGTVSFHCPIDGRRSTTREEWDKVWDDESANGVSYPRWGIVPCR